MTGPGEVCVISPRRYIFVSRMWYLFCVCGVSFLANEIIIKIIFTHALQIHRTCIACKLWETVMTIRYPYGIASGYRTVRWRARLSTALRTGVSPKFSRMWNFENIMYRSCIEQISHARKFIAFVIFVVKPGHRNNGYHTFIASLPHLMSSSVMLENFHMGLARRFTWGPTGVSEVWSKVRTTMWGQVKIIAFGLLKWGYVWDLGFTFENLIDAMFLLLVKTRWCFANIT